MNLVLAFYVGLNGALDTEQRLWKNDSMDKNDCFRQAVLEKVCPGVSWDATPESLEMLSLHVRGIADGGGQIPEFLVRAFMDLSTVKGAPESAVRIWNKLQQKCYPKAPGVVVCPKKVRKKAGGSAEVTYHVSDYDLFRRRHDLPEQAEYLPND